VELSAREFDSGVPSWSATAAWQPYRLGVEASASDQPRGDGIGVPHLARPQFIAPPHEGRNVGNKVEQLPRALRVVAEALRARDGLGDIRDVAVPPAPDLVAEESQTTSEARDNWALGDDTTVGGAAPRRCLLDYERSFWYLHLQRQW
jgi:hypothetical protein